MRARSDPPVQGPSNIVKVISKKGKIHVVKREGDVEVETEVEAEKPDLREFKLRPVQNLDLASHRKYEVVGITMESKYDDLTESDEEREVAKLTKMEQAAHKEMKHLMVIQGRLKGQIPGFAAGIHAYVTGRYPGVPSELAKPYVIPEHGQKADLLDRLPPIQVERFLQEHDRSIPRRDVVIRPGRKGISMSIDPNSDDEVYEINEMEDSLETVIRLTNPKETKEGKSAETPSAGIPATETAPKAAETAGKKEEERVLVTDVISQEMADEYTKEEELEEEESSDAETISSTSTADFDRDEVEELLNQLSTCQSALSVHYNKLNELVPHMTNTQVANYLGKAHIMPLVKVESGSVSKVYVEEDTDEEHKFVVRGDTHEEKLKGTGRDRSRPPPDASDRNRGRSSKFTFICTSLPKIRVFKESYSTRNKWQSRNIKREESNTSKNGKEEPQGTWILHPSPRKVKKTRRHLFQLFFRFQG